MKLEKHMQLFIILVLASAIGNMVLTNPPDKGNEQILCDWRTSTTSEFLKLESTSQ